MATVKEALLKLDAHERECIVRMKSIDDKFHQIEKRLDEGSVRFRKSEMMLWGMYPLIIGLFLLERGMF
jgi:hypothetical protein|tara:strand:- start:339 stop:545 length:207 start_codon:yes stop_codon:yes gene_type:complete